MQTEASPSSLRIVSTWPRTKSALLAHPPSAAQPEGQIRLQLSEQLQGLPAQFAARSRAERGDLRRSVRRLERGTKRRKNDSSNDEGNLH